MQKALLSQKCRMHFPKFLPHACFMIMGFYAMTVPIFSLTARGEHTFHQTDPLYDLSPVKVLLKTSSPALL